MQAGGPQFRVRAWQLTNGDQLILAYPLTETAATLHRLYLIELAVTAAALLFVAALGWWAVRVGLRPLVHMEDTADAIAAGELERRVPGDGARTEVGRLARASTPSWAGSKEPSTSATPPKPRCANPKPACAASSRTHPTSCARRSRRCPPTPSCSSAGASGRPEDLARVMAGIRSETARMGHLVEELLLLARLDEGRPLELEPVEIVSLASESANAARAIDDAWPITLDASRPVEVLGDPGRLRQVIDNLLGNVRAHTPPGTETVVGIAEEDSTVAIRVADSGPGLTDEQAARAFDRFYRADPSRSRDHGGSGLGLAIVAAIVAAHGGHVEALPNPGGGAVFVVRLPRVAMPEPAEVS